MNNDDNSGCGLWMACMAFAMMAVVIIVVLLFPVDDSSSTPAPGPYNSSVKVEAYVNCVGPSTAGCDRLAQGAANVLDANAVAITGNSIQSFFAIFGFLAFLVMVILLVAWINRKRSS